MAIEFFFIFQLEARSWCSAAYQGKVMGIHDIATYINTETLITAETEVHGLKPLQIEYIGLQGQWPVAGFQNTEKEAKF